VPHGIAAEKNHNVKQTDLADVTQTLRSDVAQTLLSVLRMLGSYDTRSRPSATSTT
jgi:hypothetical protein